MDASITEKRCTKCDVEKSLGCFSPHRLGRGGVRSICKPCASLATMETRRRRPESREASRRAAAKFRSSPGGAAARVAWNRAAAQAHPARYLLQRARSRAKRKGIPFGITEADIVVPEFCPVLGVRLVVARRTFRQPGVGGDDDSMSLDRRIPSLGYVPGNVRVISWRANRLKGAATVEELRALLAYMESP